MSAAVGRLIGIGALGALLVASAAMAVAAQDREPGPLAGIGKDLWQTGISCWDCHGNMANGEQEDPRSPTGANLRESALDVDQIAEVIRCGRPGTPMPYFGNHPYAGKEPCYGVTEADLGDQLPPRGAATLNARQINALAQFIAYQFVGRGPATKEECVAFFGESASSCNRWPAKADVAPN
jgi:hypothetical protein